MPRSLILGVLLLPLLACESDTLTEPEPPGNGGRFAYVTNWFSASVSVIDVATNTVVGLPIPVGEGPLGIAITPDGFTAYVTNRDSDDVSLIDVATNMVLGLPIPVGRSPAGIAIAVVPGP